MTVTTNYLVTGNGITGSTANAVQALVLGYGILATPDSLAATRSQNRILSALRDGRIVGHRGLGGIATGTAASLPTPDPMSGSIGTDPEHGLSAYIKGYTLGIRVFEIDVWGENGYLIHDQDPRRVVRAPAFATGEVLAAGSYRTNGGNTYRALTDGTCGATAPTGTALTPISDGAVQWLWVEASLPTDVTALSRSQYRDLRLSASYFMGPGYENEPLVLLRDLVAALGTDAMFIMEAKDTGGGRAIANVLREFNIPQDMALVAGFFPVWAATKPARDLGYGAVLYGPTADTYTPAYVAAQGAIAYGSLDQDTWTAAKIAAFHAAGIITSPALNLNNRTNYAAMRAIGHDWITSDEPLYLSGLGAVDDGVWTDQRWPAGMVMQDATPGLTDGGRGVLKLSSTGARGWGFSTYTTTPKSVLMGQFVLPKSFKRRFWAQLQSSGAANQGIFLPMCCPTDKRYLDLAGNYGEGYLIRLRKNGVMDIYKTTSGMTLGSPDATATATGAGTDLQANRCQFEIERFWDGTAASFIKVTNITGGGVSATLFDAEYTGQYMHIGHTQAT